MKLGHLITFSGGATTLGAALLASNLVQGPTPGQRQRLVTLTPAQEEILSHLSIVYLDDGQGGTAKTVRLTGTNLQIVNGLGATNGYPAKPFDTGGSTSTNGVGNLIVGYNELDGSDDRTGSHNIVAGTANDYTSFGGVAFGRYSRLDGPLAAVLGGTSNRAEAMSVVCGGEWNEATGLNSVVSGGYQGEASGTNSSVGGGAYCAATASMSAVAGGRQNTASFLYSFVGGGYLNTASGNATTVVGGNSSDATGLYATVSGGQDNLASGQACSVNGGRDNWADGYGASIGAGRANAAFSDYSWIGGGNNNSCVTQSYGSVAGGYQNQVSGLFGSVSGGWNRSVAGNYDWRGGGLFENQ